MEQQQNNQQNKQQKKKEKQLKKATIIPERIWSKETEYRGEPTTRWFIKYKNFIFSGFQEPDFKEREKVEITYDYNSKYIKEDEQGGITIFYNLISKKVSNREILKEIKKLEEKLDLLLKKGENNTEVEGDSTFSPEDLKEEDIPTVEDEDTL